MQDSESLDRCIQKALAAVYPPFQATSPTLLCQVLSVVDSCFRGDGLHYLIHFLLPSKHFLQNLQQDACTPFSGLLFRHEGWPLCIHDKIVVQLCPLDQHLLHPGDFYLLVSPAAATLACGAHSASCRSSVSVNPCLLLCSVSAGSRHVEQQEVPLEALTSLFSMAWLDSVNRERERRGATRLERCVLSAHGDVFRVPWEDVVYPQFINRPRTTTNQERESSLKDKNDPRLSKKDVKLLPFPAKPNQSTVSSDDEDSEGEYVELTELPVLTRFSPQKGSLTQSISLQHRTRTTIHTKLHTDTLTPHTEIQSTSHTNTHLHQLSTETSQNTRTPSTTVTPSSIAHFNSNTHSCFCTEVSSHTLQCCKLRGENFSQDSSGVLHISSGPPITCSAPPEVKEQTEGTTSGGSPNMHAQPERCTHHGEGKENEQKVGEEEQGKEEEKEANNRRSEGLESVCGEREERLQQVKETESQSKEEEEESEEGNRNEAQLEEVEEEVQSQERKEEQVMNVKKEGEVEEKKTGCEEYIDIDLYPENEQQRHSEDSYSEAVMKQFPGDSCCKHMTTNKRPEDFYFENITEKINPEDSCCENMTQTTHPRDFQFKSIIEREQSESYFENITQKSNPVNHASENETQENVSEYFYSDSTIQTQSEDSYFEIGYLQRPSNKLEGLNSGHDFPEEFKTIPRVLKSEDSYSENLIQQTQPGDSYSENQTQPEDSYSENQTQPEDSYSENQTQPEDSHSEKRSQTKDCYSEKQTHFNDSYSETQSQSIGSYSEKQIQAEDSHSETRTQPEDSYSENQTQPVDSYSENWIQPEDYSENPTKLTQPHDSLKNKNQTQLWDSYTEDLAQSEEKPTQPVDSYFENQIQPQDYPSEKQTQQEDSYSEKQTQQEDSHTEAQTQLEDSYSKNQIQPEDYYSEKPTQLEDSYYEKQTEWEDSHSETQKQLEDFYAENQIQPEDHYSEKQSQLEDSYSETQTQLEDSYSEKQPQPQDSYSEKHIQAEDSCSENQSPEDYSENPTQPDDSFKNENQTQLQDYHSEDPAKSEEIQTQSVDFYFENQIQPQDYHSEDPAQSEEIQTQSVDFYFENQIQPQDYHSEDPAKSEEIQTQSVDFYFENQIQPQDYHSKDPAHSGENHTEHPPPVSIEGQGNGDDQMYKEKEEEQLCDKNVGRRSTDHQPEGSTCECLPDHSHISAGSSPEEPENPLVAPAQSSQSSQSRFHVMLLRSGAVCLPGTRDRAGRALLTISTSNPVWLNPDCDRVELLRLLLYYISTLRMEARAKGLTVLVDVRRAAPGSAIFPAFQTLQEDMPGSIHTVLILANKDSSLRLDKAAPAQVEVLSSLKSLQRHMELQQLPEEFGGSFSFSQSSWISFRSRVEQLTKQCTNVIDLLQETISTLQGTPLPAAAEDAELLLSKYRAVMCSTLEDIRLVQLQQEGGASLAWLRREEVSGVSEEQRAAVESVSSLYDQVDELLHRLVTLSNSKMQELSFIVEFRSLEQGFSQVRTWLDEVGEVHLKTLNEHADSLELLNRKQQDFKEFHTTAYDHCKQGEALLTRLERWDDVSSPDLHIYEVKVHSFWAQLQDFSQRVKGTGQNIERAVQLYRFLDQAYGWALEGMRQLAAISMEDCTQPDKCRAVIGCLEDYRLKHSPIPESRFQEMKAEAGELRGERGLRQWSFAWSKCQETKKMFDRKMEAALRTRDSAHRHRSNSVISTSSASSRKSGLWGICETSFYPLEEETSTSPSPPTPQRTPFLRRLLRSSSYMESERQDVCAPFPSLSRLNSSPSFTPSFPSVPSSPSFPSSSSSSRRQQLRKTQSFDCPSTPEVSRCGVSPRIVSEPPHRGNTGVFIRGLEVSSTEAADRTLCPRTPVQGWAVPQSPGTPGTSTGESRPRGSKLRHIVEEMVTTEREYVRSLRYIIHHYFPEMERADLPQDLRGKRSIIFGNLEKLLNFHSQFFLRELEACWKHPLRVPHCFLRHQEQFSLYALYSKNKPKSDALLANHGHAFFRRKQLELGDKMDLSSYLLKPIQRMSKYALLLTDLIKEVGVAQEAELTALQDATNMVKFQLRHGNDLLAMDAIRDCDVNLKEQGQLIRQDEFTAWSGRRKCQRRIFLFEDLVLFSKLKKMEGGLDVFIYKHSFKTADLGLTESSGDNGLKFEIWFRRRTTKNQTFILQAATVDIKHAWTIDIAQILWTQASRNKEMRLKEMVSMGVGNKPYLDIQPSDAAISDRAVHYIMKARGARTRASIAVSAFDHAHPFQRGATSEPTASGPSSSSLLGPLNLHMFSQSLPSAPPTDVTFSSSCIEEDELEHETSSQPSMTTESSGSSSHCLSGSTGSDSGCVSSLLQEALQEEPSPPCQPSSSSSSSTNKQHQNSDFISPEAAEVVSAAMVV
ncbi:rho guanine nucleotide exchange factor 40 isoform X3 [Girardinichthys multiradiatus]|uniref:rho guanine nucleotide exchange factor 40 isoform X3 n=1 Tax=Girardinichthys multiradiatus TaxID=208333 RepID=UPI001FAD973A|nr:rho guanine nucleotide exchange factor 40 isoform X3 [Girardinichthys multiradiatus]